MKILQPLSAVVLVVAVAAVANARDLEPLMLEKGKLILEEDFAKGVPSSWTVAKGKWAIANGALQGAERAADNHAAVIRTDLEFPPNFLLQFDFRFDGGKVIHLSFNGKGHICRATITPSGFALKGEKVKKNPDDKTAVVGQVQQVFEAGKWYTMLVEIKGDEIVARVDDHNIAFGSDAKVARPKTNFGFPMAGVSSSVDNIKVWAAEPNSAWVSLRKSLPANKIVPPTPPTAAERFARLDKDNNGQISMDEFVGSRPKAAREAAAKAFNRRDKDGSKSLSLAEYSPAPKKK